MDPFSPINGLSLERYADLGAALDGKDKDPKATAEVLRAEGVSPADYEAPSADAYKSQELAHEPEALLVDKLRQRQALAVARSPT